MAIFGTFDEIPPPEALTAAGSRSGVFVARVPPAQVYEVFVQGGVVTNLRKNDRPAGDVLSLHASFEEMLTARSGEFEFRRLPAAESPGPFSVAIDQMIVNGLAGAAEIKGAADLLPSPQTVFISTGEFGLWLGEDLQVFWERTESALGAGADAEDLAALAGTAVAKAQWFLYKLRLAGMVSPLRQQSAEPPRRLYRQPAPVAASPSPSASPIESAAGRLRAVALAKPSRPLFRRLIDGLAGLLVR